MNTTVKSWDLLRGQYQLLPGAQPAIAGQRPVLGAGRLGHLLCGQRGAQVSRTLTSVFTLCAHAHRRAAEMALDCAQQGLPPTPQPAPLHLLETARDHLRSIALDWPQRLPECVPAIHTLEWLRGCPLSLVAKPAGVDAASAPDVLERLRAWLEERVLHEPVSDWLTAHRDPDALARWCSVQAPGLLPARCLAHGHALAQGLTPPMRSLDLLDADPARQSAHLSELAQQLAHETEFAQRPTWRGACAETGPWTRLRHRGRQMEHSAWTRFSARWLELVEIAAAPNAAERQGAPLLSCGALPLAQGQALAWCEMARGLLLHWVQLDAQGAVLDYRVLAPTEWNFHPDGALARAVSALSPGATAAAQTLAAAFDPCVACTVQPHAAGASDGT